jgi:CDP-glycerol glycerophosphotransferase
LIKEYGLVGYVSSAKAFINDRGEWYMGNMSIPRAMKKEMYSYNVIETEKQNWESFQECVKEKQLFLFGAGKGLNHFLRNYGKQIHIDGVIDNNPCIQGQNLGTCCDEAWQTKYDILPVYAPKVLMEYSKEDIVVLITSTYFYEPMFKQMEEMGIENCYVLSMMETDVRSHLTNKENEETGKIREDYIDEYCRQDIEEKKIIMLIGVYGSHARQITKALLRVSTDLDIVWIVNDMRVETPDGVRLVYGKNYKRYVYEMETAKIWIFDDIISPQIRKRESQIYIQVKHWSSITLKKFYLEDKSPVLTPEVEAAIKYDGARMDYLFSGSEFDEASFQRGFMFQGENIRVGSPRSDILFDSEITKKVKKHFHLGKSDKICLYVPTYRLEDVEKNRNISIALDMELLLKVLRKKWEGEWFLLVRFHPGLILKDNILMDSPYIINAGKYTDSEELVAASDIMVTDYSSIMFEAAYKKEPVFLYAPDREKYIGKERELLIDYNMLPFPIAESNEELNQNIMEFEIEKYQESIKAFMDGYGVCEDGHASERAAEFIIELLEKCLKEDNYDVQKQ